jgi:hypothetical protein
MSGSMFVRRIISLALVISAVIIVGLLMAYVHTPESRTIAVNEHGGSVRFEANRTRVVFTQDCIRVRWQTDQVKAVYIDGSPTIGEGERDICGHAPRLRVIFADDTRREYQFDRDVVLDQTPTRLLLIGAASLIVAAGWLSGIWSVLWNALLTTPLGRPIRAINQHVIAPMVDVARCGWNVFWQEDRWHQATLAALIVVAFGLRLLYVSQPLRYDEAHMYVDFGSNPLSESLSSYSTTNNHLFLTLLEYILTGVLGISVWVIRLPDFVAGVLIVPSIYVVGRLLYNRHAGLIAAALATSAMSFILYSTNSRGYAMTTLFFLWQIGLAYALRTHRSTLAWIGFAVVTALSLYTIPTAIFQLAIVGTWLFLSILIENKGRVRLLLLRDLFLTAVLTVTLTMLFYSPVFHATGIESVTNIRFVRPVPMETFLETLPGKVSSVWRLWTMDIPPLVALLMAVFAVVSVIWHRRIAHHAIPLLPVGAVMITLVTIARQIPIYPRVYMFLLALFFIAVAAGASMVLMALANRQNNRFERVLSAACLCLALGMAGLVLASQSVWRNTETSVFRAAEAATLYLKPRLRGDEVVFTANGAEPMIRFYFDQYQIPREILRRPNHAPERIYIVVSAEDETLTQFFKLNDDLLDGYGQYTQPELIQTFNEVEIYLLERTEA